MKEALLNFLFLVVSFLFKNVFYLKSGRWKQGFSGEKSILAFCLEKKFIANNFQELQLFVEKYAAQNKKVFAIIKYEQDARSSLQAHLNSGIFDANLPNILYVFKFCLTINLKPLKKACCGGPQMAEPSAADRFSETENLSAGTSLKNLCGAALQAFFRNQNIKTNAKIHSNMSDEQYLQKTAAIINHIKNGDLIQTNFTRKFFGQFAKKLSNTSICRIFLSLARTSQVCYSSFVKDGPDYILCLSPERFLKKDFQKIIANPIKGSAKLFEVLLSEKNKAENLMIADLMRNDLSKICIPLTVKSRLFDVDRYTNILHLSSNIEGQLTPQASQSIASILSACLPIGSMSGAPKQMATTIARQYEQWQRGIYSGSIGYLYPVYNKNQKYAKARHLLCNILFGRNFFRRSCFHNFFLGSGGSGKATQLQSINFDLSVVIRSLFLQQLHAPAPANNFNKNLPCRACVSPPEASLEVPIESPIKTSRETSREASLEIHLAAHRLETRHLGTLFETQAGGAITALSNPTEELAELYTKLKIINSFLSG